MLSKAHLTSHSRMSGSRWVAALKKSTNNKCWRLWRKGKIEKSECRVSRIARRDKKAFFSDQCKEIEENNRMGKTRELFKKIRDTKGTFHAKMGSIKDRNGPNRSRRY